MGDGEVEDDDLTPATGADGAVAPGEPSVGAGRGRWWLLLPVGVVLVVLGLVVVGLLDDSESSDAGSGSSDESADDSTEPTAESTTSTSAPPPTVPPPPEPIPGLVAADVQAALQAEGWTCSEQPNPPAGYAQSICQLPGSYLALTTIAETTGGAVFLQVTGAQADELPWLERLAAMPFGGADPAPAAASWVGEQVAGGAGTDGSTRREFGGVGYELFVNTGTDAGLYGLQVGTRPPDAPPT